MAPREMALRDKKVARVEFTALATFFARFNTRRMFYRRTKVMVE